MLSLPIITPQDDSSTWLRTTYRPRAESPPPVAGQNPHQTHRERQRRDEAKRQYNSRSPLALLAADEAAIEHRKAAVRNFGSQWIRPPGVPKTLQAMTEEALEREELAELERQEAGLRDMQAQQQLAEVQGQAGEAAAAADAGDGEEDEEHNLDDDIPEADASDQEDVTFNEDSMMEGSHIADLDHDGEQQYADMEEAELTGAARDEEELGLGMERDLDDSVPEAGSYQHTDTEAEDSSSESGLNSSSLIGRSVTRRSSARTPADRAQMQAPQAMAALQQRMRVQVSAADSLPRSPGSWNLSSSILDSSLVADSPVVQRSNGGGRARGSGSGGRARRGGRYN